MTIYIACLPEGNNTNIEIRKWYNKDWKIVFRPTSEKLALSLVEYALKAQSNINIVHNNFEKSIIFNFLKQYKWNIDKIEESCNATNYSLISCYIASTGIFINQELTYKNISQILSNTGRFNKLTNDIYLLKSDKLKVGDILVNENDAVLVVSCEELISTPEQQQGNNIYVNKNIGKAISIKKTNIKNGEGEKYKTIFELKKNKEVEVLEITQDNWYKIVWPQAICGYAYVNGNDFNYKGKNPNPTISKIVRYEIKVIIDKLKIQLGPNASKPTIGFLNKNEIRTIIREENNYGLLQSGKGWINLDGIKKV